MKGLLWTPLRLQAFDSDWGGLSSQDLGTATVSLSRLLHRGTSGRVGSHEWPTSAPLSTQGEMPSTRWVEHGMRPHGGSPRYSALR